MIATNAALLISGISGSGKTTQLGTAAEYLWETYKKKLRLYTCDAGGFPNKVEVLVKHKIIEVWRMRTRVGAGGEGLIEETCAQASRGAWPREVKAHDSGDSPERIEMMPFSSTVLILSCQKGHEVKRGSNDAALSPTLCMACNQQVTLQNGQVQKILTPNFPHIGGLAFDGISSMSMWILTALRRRRASPAGLTGGEKSALGKFQSGDMWFDGNNRADYGFAQGQAEEWINNSISLSGLCLPPIWTSLETLDESPTRPPVWGPMIAGQAKTSVAPQWVGNYVGCQQVMTEKGKEWRLYLTEYRGPDGIPHNYKCRIEPGQLPDYLVDAEGEKPLTTFNLGVFFRLLEGAFERSMKESAEKYGEVPDFSEVKAPEPVKPQPPAAPQPVGQRPGAAPMLGGAARPATLPPLGQTAKPLVKAPIVGKK